MTKKSGLKDLLMILLYAKGHREIQCEAIQGRTRLVKMVFLFKEELWRKLKLNKVIPEKALPDFQPYDFGPFAPEVFSDLEFLVETGFVEERVLANERLADEEALELWYWRSSSAATDEDLEEQQTYQYQLTQLGRDFVQQELRPDLNLTDDQMKLIDDFKSRCTGTSLRSLLRYVYAKYPKMTTKSKIRDEILSQEPY